MEVGVLPVGNLKVPTPMEKGIEKDYIRQLLLLVSLPVKNLSSQLTHTKLTLNLRQAHFEDTYLAHSKLTR